MAAGLIPVVQRSYDLCAGLYGHSLRITLRLAHRLGFLSNGGDAELSEVADEVGRMLGG